jgi:hypothetical protein
MRGQCNAAEECFIQQATADDVKSMAFQQSGEIGEQIWLFGNDG